MESPPKLRWGDLAAVWHLAVSTGSCGIGDHGYWIRPNSGVSGERGRSAAVDGVVAICLGIAVAGEAGSREEVEEECARR